MIFLCFAVSPSASRSLCQCSVDSKNQLHFKQCKCCKKGDQTHASLHQMSASSDKRFYSPNKVWRHFSVDGESSCWSESVAVSGKRWFYILLTVLTVVCRWPGAYLHPHLGHLADAFVRSNLQYSTFIRRRVCEVWKNNRGAPTSGHSDTERLISMFVIRRYFH